MECPGPVFITGGAAYTCCGLGVDALRAGLRRNGERMGPTESLGCAASSREERPRLSTNADQRLAGRMLAAVEQDLGAFLRSLPEPARERCGVALGSAYGQVGSYREYFEVGTRQGYQFVNPRHFPGTLPNFCAVELSNAYSLWGSTSSISSGFAAGLEAVGYAALRIRHGDEWMMLAGGVDELNDLALQSLRRAGLLSTSGMLRPLLESHDGTVPTEGAGILMLHSEATITEFGREPLAEICGFASAGRVFWNDPTAAVKAATVVDLAVAESSLDFEDIEAVFPSASGTLEGDAFEMALLNKLFGMAGRRILLFPIKTITGECFAASGALQCLAAALVIKHGEDHFGGDVPLELDGTAVNLARDIRPVRTALVYGSGYDGSFCAAVLRRAEL